MKSMKIASAAMLAMVGLGFAASPASAATESTAEVTITAGTTLSIEEVPDFSFTSTVTSNGEYTIKAAQTGPEGNKTIGDMKVFRNYDVSGEDVVNKVQANIVDLTYDTESDKTSVSVTSFKINGNEIGIGTGNVGDVFNDSAFTTPVSDELNRYTAKINSAEIGFTDSTIGISGRTLTGKVVYTVYTVAP